MEVAFRITIDDYLAFYPYFFFRRRLGLRIPVIALLVCLVVVNGGNKDGRVIFTWTDLLTVVGVTIFIIALNSGIPYLRTIRKVRKVLAAPDQSGQKRMILSADGFTVRGEDEAGTVITAGSWRWESVKYVDSTAKFVFIMLVNRELFLIPRQYFQADDAVANFIGIVRNETARVTGTDKESNQAKARRIAPWGFVGLVPNFGVIAGVVLLYQGIVRLKSRLLVIIGVADILFTILFWVAIQHWVFDGPVFTRLNKEMSQGMLNTVFKSVEFFKLQHGHYPDSLQQIEDIKGYVWITDPLSKKVTSPQGGNFYYQKTGDRYWLFSVGEDGQPFTADDMYPAMNPADSTKFGLRLR
jgi:hypothetical protein